MEFSAVGVIGNDIVYMEPRLNIHLEESIIAQQARSGGEPDAHIRACGRCTGIFEFYRAYFPEEQKSLVRPVTEHDRDRVRSILSPGMYAFVPYRMHLQVNSPHLGGSPYLLAAQDRSAHRSRIHSIASFASEAINTVIRVLRDSDSGTTSLHILADDRQYLRRVEVAVTDHGGRTVHVRTDDDGVGIVDETVPIDWKSARLLLITPQPAAR
jgi:hypothetical protein